MQFVIFIGSVVNIGYFVDSLVVIKSPNQADRVVNTVDHYGIDYNSQLRGIHYIYACTYT